MERLWSRMILSFSFAILIFLNFSCEDVDTGARILTFPGGLAIAEDGDIFLTIVNPPAVLRVNPDTGEVTTVSGSGVGSGPGFSSPRGLTLDNEGIIFVTDSDLRAVFSVAPLPVTGISYQVQALVPGQI